MKRRPIFRGHITDHGVLRFYIGDTVVGDVWIAGFEIGLLDRWLVRFSFERT